MAYIKAAGTLRGISDNGVTISSTSVSLEDLGFSAENILLSDIVQLTSYDQNIRYRYTGSAVANNTGHLIAAGEEAEFVGKDIISKLQFIAESVDAGVWITLARYGI